MAYPVHTNRKWLTACKGGKNEAVPVPKYHAMKMYRVLTSPHVKTYE